MRFGVSYSHPELLLLIDVVMVALKEAFTGEKHLWHHSLSSGTVARIYAHKTRAGALVTDNLGKYYDQRDIGVSANTLPEGTLVPRGYVC